MSMVTVAASRKERWCEQYYGPWGHDPVIKRGDLYVTLTLSPGMARNEGVGDEWMSARICIECALGGSDHTAIKVIQALYKRGVLADYPSIPPRLVLAAGHALGVQLRRQQNG